MLSRRIKALYMKSGIEYMTFLADWLFLKILVKAVGFFQIGAGTGDFLLRMFQCYTRYGNA
jgi:hypothetical protein